MTMNQPNRVTSPAATVDRLPTLLDSWPAPVTGTLADARERALSLFPEIPLPHGKMEDWRHFSIADLLGDAYQPILGQAEIPVDQSIVTGILPSEETLAELVFLNGAYRPDWSRESTVTGVYAGSLAAAARDPHLVPAVNGSLGTVLELRDPFACLNTMFLADGAFVWIGRDTQQEKPVHVVFVHARPGGTVSFPRLLIHVGENANARVIISHVFAEPSVSSWDNVAGEVILDAGARLELDETAGVRGQAARFLSLMAARVDRDARLTWRVFTLGGALVRRDSRVLLAAPGAEAHVSGLFVNSGKNMMDHPVRVRHTAPHGTSRITFKGVALEESRSVYTGKVYVDREAQKTDSIQVNHNLVLSPDARVETRPQLEIYADDVRCTHGATAGPPPAEIVYYFRSRGISADRARNILIRGFVEEISDQISTPSLRSRVSRVLAERFGDHES